MSSGVDTLTTRIALARTSLPAEQPELGPDDLFEVFLTWCDDRGITPYQHQEDAVVELFTGAHTIVTTPTGSGKSLIALAAHTASLAAGGRSYYTAPIKALVSEKFFELCRVFGAEQVGMVTGDAAVNPDAPIICCTAEILANIALRETPPTTGHTADPVAHSVVLDEFHFIADPQRGWAWQTIVSELGSQLLILSATLGDTSALVAGLERRSKRPVAVIGNAVRPVPLVHRWALTPVAETVAELMRDDQAPIYLVHASQAAAVEQAQALLTAGTLPKRRRSEIVAAVGQFRFAPGFGRTLQSLILSGIGVHHAGMLPKYRRLVETLAQLGLLPVICGTDTLGVGINVPIRTVLFTQLTKFDGHRQRVLRAREFHQIAGRAGRAGFDSVGYVVAQAPEHVIENARAIAKAGDDPKKLRKIQRKKAPEGVVSWTEQTFERLIDAQPETLIPRLRITHSMLLNLLQRDQDTVRAVQHLVNEATPDPAARRRLYRQALQLGRSMLASGVVVRLDQPTPGGRRFALSPDLQVDFALNQPLSAFAVAMIEVLDPESPDYPLDLISVVEATLENPMQVLLAQQFRARGEAVAEMKADGVEYDERMDALAEIEWPRPLNDLLEHTFGIYRQRHPWLSPDDLRPKSVVREMIERAQTFGEYVAFHKVQRSEGLLLRYLTDAYRALRQTVPESARTEDFDDLVEWLGEVIRLTDSSLLDEWEALTHPSDAGVVAAPPPERPVTGNERAFKVLVRNAMFRRVQLIADDQPDELADLDAVDGATPSFTGDDWDAALEDYYAEHAEVLLDATARGPALLRIEPRVTASGERNWEVSQIIHDPEGNHDWQIQAVVDLDASDDVGALVLRVVTFGRVD